METLSSSPTSDTNPAKRPWANHFLSVQPPHRVAVGNLVVGSDGYGSQNEYEVHEFNIYTNNKGGIQINKLIDEKQKLTDKKSDCKANYQHLKCEGKTRVPKPKN